VNTNNPYAAPKSSVTTATHSECRRDGKHAFVPTGSDLPPRCIVCNDAAQTPIKERTLYWHSPWLYLLVLVNLLIYAVIALIFRSKTKVSPGYCATHLAARQRKINWFRIPAFLLMLGGIGIMVVDEPSSGIIVVVLGFLLVIPAIIVSNTFRAVRIDKSGAKFSGCKEPFLASLE
jgi:hypothetical protein